MEDPAAQQRALAEANKRVMQEAFLMKRATVRLQRSPLAPLEASAADREKRDADRLGLFPLCWQPPAAATEQQIFLVVLRQCCLAVAPYFSLCGHVHTIRGEFQFCWA